tara:strand:- start:46 stop:324 length:279 start_codon:yes stop_codon:yes gene_type:complete
MGGPFARMSAEARRKLIEAMNAQKADAEQSAPKPKPKPPTTDATKTVGASSVTPVRPAQAVDAKNTRRAAATEKKKKKRSLLKTRGLLADIN